MARTLIRWLEGIGGALLLAWFAFLRPPFMFGGSGGYIIVQGHSMEPTMYTGDLAVLHRQGSYDVGDVIAFHSGQGTVIHRITGGDAASGYEMLGDNNPHPDPWHPKPDAVIGRMLFHVPKVGGWAKSAREGSTFNALFGAAAAGVVVPGAIAVRKRRKGGRLVNVPNSTRGALPASLDLPVTGALAEVPRAVAAAFFGATALAGLAALLAFVAFRTAPEQSKMTPSVQFTQSGAFDYNIEVAPATIYPAGLVRPQEGAEAKDAARPDQAVFTRLANAINVDYHYALEADPERGAAVYGTVRTDLEVRAVDGWSRVTPLTPPRAFEGSAVDEHVRVDFRALATLLNRIEAETGFEAKSYELLVTPTVDIKGHVGADSVSETFGSSLLVKFDPQRVTPSGVLSQTKPTARAELVRTPNVIGLGPVQLGVAVARVVGAAVAAGAGVVAAMLGAVIFLGVGRGADAQIRARYGSMLLRVAAAEDETVRDRVRVVSIRDLARLAQRAGVLILEEQAPEGPRYFVRDGDAVYEFVPERPRRRHRFGTFPGAGGASDTVSVEA